MPPRIRSRDGTPRTARLSRAVTYASMASRRYADSVSDVRTGSSVTVTYGDLSKSRGATHTVRVRVR